MNEKEIVKMMDDAIECIKKLEASIVQILTRQKNLEEGFMEIWLEAGKWEAESNANYEEAHKLSAYIEMLESQLPALPESAEKYRSLHGISDIMQSHKKDREDGV